MTRTVMADKRWAAKYPALGTGPVAAESCISAEYFERERDLIFRRSWINVGRVDEIPERGQYFVRELAVCHTSILVMRGKDGKVRGFHNVCAHRGNRLVPHERGQCPGKLMCNFHFWTYDTEGRLSWVPDEENFHGLDKAKLGLTPVRTDVWEGFIFVNLDDRGSESLEDYLDGVGRQLKGAPFGRLARLRTYKVDERANWKVAIDAQNEVYHLPFQHRYTFPDAFVLKDNRYTRLFDVNLYKRHSVWSCEYNADYKVSALGGLLSRLDGLKNAPRFTQMIGDFDFFLVFPNMVILLFKGAAWDFVVTYNFWPLAVDHTIWEIRYYYPPADNAATRLAHEYSICRLRDTLQEDAKAHEAIHAGLRSRAKRELHLQDDEICIRYFHQVVDDHAGLMEAAE